MLKHMRGRNLTDEELRSQMKDLVGNQKLCLILSVILITIALSFLFYYRNYTNLAFIVLIIAIYFIQISENFSVLREYLRRHGKLEEIESAPSKLNKYQLAFMIGLLLIVIGGELNRSYYPDSGLNSTQARRQFLEHCVDLNKN